MPIETFDDVLEWLADRAGVYGCGENDDHEPDCPCRICFVIEAEERILKAIEIEQRLSNPHQ